MMHDSSVYEDVPVDVRNPEGKRPGPHPARIDEIIIVSARNRFERSLRGKIFHPRDRIAVVSNLHRRPPLVASILEMVNDRPGNPALDAPPFDRNSAEGGIGDEGERQRA